MKETIAKLKTELTRDNPVLRRWGWGFAVLALMPFTLFFADTYPPVEQPWGYYSERPHLTAVAALAGPLAGDHVRTPEFVKGIYVTADSVGSKKRFAQLLDLAKRTEINSLVIDLKNHKYELAFRTEDPTLRPYAASRPVLGDLKDVAKAVHEAGLYLIARYPVFQDPTFAAKNPKLTVQSVSGGPWRDHRGLLWLDPAAQEVWEYAATIGETAIAAGFDEIQFDYVRFPSDGVLSAIRYPIHDGQKRKKEEVIGAFFAYLNQRLRVELGAPISADLFGLTMWNLDSDMNIGQRLQNILPYVDFISPMVYPSHYPNGYNGFANPALHPYEIIFSNMKRGQGLRQKMAAEPDAPEMATFRPWLQDFDMGAEYDAARVRAQMQAAVDGGASGWLLWNAANVYTEGALLSENDV